MHLAMKLYTFYYNIFFRTDNTRYLFEELNTGFTQKNVYSLDYITDTYCDLVEKEIGERPEITNKRMKDRLQVQYQNNVTFQRQRQFNLPFLIFPPVSIGQVLRACVASQQERQNDVVFRWREVYSDTRILFYAALKIKLDLNKTEGITDYSIINVEAARKCVLDSLYMLIYLILDDNNMDNNLSITDESTEKSILNVCQDILYLQSKGKKLAQKHVGISLTVHHTIT